MTRACVPIESAQLEVVQDGCRLRTRYRPRAGMGAGTARRSGERGARSRTGGSARGPAFTALLLLVERWRRGERVRAHEVAALLPPAGAFTQSCWRAAMRIPRGKTWTYAQLASRAGRPRAARAAAAAMAANPLAPLVPCHRVVAAGGIGGFCGIDPSQSAHWASRLKRALLRAEGAVIPGPRGRTRSRSRAAKSAVAG